MSHLPHRIKKYKISNTTYTLSHSCDTHYLSKNLKSEISYTLEFRESSLSIKDTKSNKDIAFILTKETPQLQEKQILLDSKNLQALQTILELHTYKETRVVYVEVKLSKWDRLKIAYQHINNLGKFERDPIQKAKPKYELVGGEPYDKFKNAPHTYENTCALRMSYALNYGGIPITKPTPNTKAFLGNDKKIYVLGSQDIRDFLYVKWKYQAPYNPKSMNSKKENEDFYNNELLQFSKNGIIVMRIDGWGESAYGHTTLWDGTKKRFLDDSNYLLDKRSNVIVRQFYFWEIE
ncbi:MAG: type VI secretion system amidase effector protein Tae4 [Helicobacter trogontum]|uniref:type VI secretion system amidase effector protein Tae4 n=1 Tax=Helicobacter trogontum TaxID=50960 RepID=UPI00242EEB1C|nr:type VI secretion system amidase effector protein Tae4 [Helicobacter trogontum]MCI5785988.1 type VI secretion system amidase effector protein Tae4 [Helicobacter trogontum]